MIKYDQKLVTVDLNNNNYALVNILPTKLNDLDKFLLATVQINLMTTFTTAHCTGD